MQGKIILIGTKYVIEGIKKIVKYNPIIHRLIPGDIVEYTVNPQTDKINIIKLIKRNPLKTIGIIDSNNKIICPELPNIFDPTPLVKLDSTNKSNHTLVLQIDINGVHIISIYDPLNYTRLNDVKLALDLYKPILTSLDQIPKLILEDNQVNLKHSNSCINLTHLSSQTFNIDPVNSKDFDDAITFDISNSKIYIHIVDIESQIELGSQIDLESLAKSFTLYLPEYIENILPDELATNQLSLIQGEARKCISIEYTLNPDNFEIISKLIYPSIIKIGTRYNYEEYDELLEQDNNSQLNKFVYKIINKFSYPSLATPSVSLNINLLGKMEGYSINHLFTPSHNLISSLMILTNITMSEYTINKIPQRYHSATSDKPIQIYPHTSNQSIDSILAIKKYRRALYSSIESGHYGLDLQSYTHFTSPIRRYFDTIVHRLVSGYKFTEKSLIQVLDYINSREKHIDSIVRLYTKIKILDYLNMNLNKIWSGYSIGPNKIILQDLLFEIYLFNKLDIYTPVQIQIKAIDWINLVPEINLIL